jgi:hypothetical protein
MGKPHPGPLPRRLTERLLQGRRVRHGAPRAIDEKGAMPMPPLVVQGGVLHGPPEALQEEVKKAQRESGASLAVCCRPEP